MEPIVNGLETELGEQAAFVRLDADLAENAKFQQSYGLRGHPTFVVLDGRGELSAAFIGPQTEETLRQAVLEAIASKE